jgi:hypothetical protein
MLLYPIEDVMAGPVQTISFESHNSQDSQVKVARTLHNVREK